MSALSIENLTAAMKAPALGRVERYMARVEAHLPTFPNVPARLAFLKREEAKWIERYQAWRYRMDTDTADAQDLTQTAWDYVETIAAVRKRHDDLQAEAK